MLCILTVGTCVWAGLLEVKGMPLWVPSMLLLLATIVADMVLLQRPWYNHDHCGEDPCEVCRACADGARKNYLWVCHRADFEEATNEEAVTFLGAEKSGSSNLHRGRLVSLKTDSGAKMAHVVEELVCMRRHVDQVVSGFHAALQSFANQIPEDVVRATKTYSANV